MRGWSLRLAGPALALSLVVGCTPGGAPTGPGKPPTPKPASARPGGPASAGPTGPNALPPGPVIPVPATLTGKVKLLPALSAELLANNSAGVVSNSGGKILSDNGAGLVANNGGGYRLLQATPAEWALADADVSLTDAGGKPITGPDGAALAARTDATGSYRFEGALPPGNLVLRVKLWTGGELSALLARGSAAEVAQDVNTATSLGAAFVLDRLVKGDQAKLDKLPPAEATKLHADLEANRQLLAARPSYAAAQLAADAEALRRQAPAVDASLKAIEALLLGQATIGDGTLAIEVPINRPFATAATPEGDVLIAEYGLGRVRVVGKDGVMRTLVDEVRGTVKRNFGRMNDMVRTPDGTLYLSTLAEGKVQRIAPDGTVAVAYDRTVAGGFSNGAIAVAPDGTLYVGERRTVGDASRAPKLVAIAPGQAPKPVALPQVAAGGICGLALAADGALWALINPTTGTGLGSLQRFPAVGGAFGPAETIASDLQATAVSGFSLAADGTAYVAEEAASRVVAIAPGGARKVLAGPGGEAGAPALDLPTSANLGPDGSLYVTDWGDGRVHVRKADGTWRPFAGLDGNFGADGRSIALNSPLSVGFDAQDRLLIAENGRDRVVRYENGTLVPVAGGRKGDGGDGGPALDARFDGIIGMTVAGDAIYVLDTGNNRIRRIGPDGMITGVAGTHDGQRQLYPTGPFPVAQLDLGMASALAADSQGRLYWSNTGRDQVFRLGAPGMVDIVAGKTRGAKAAPTIADLLGDRIVEGEPAPAATLRYPLGLAFEPSGDLLVADCAHGQVRRVRGLAGPDWTIGKVIGAGLEGALAVLGGAPQSTSTNAVDVALAAPSGLCVDARGNIYVSELGSRRLDLMADVFSDGLALDGKGLPVMAARVWKFAPDGTGTVIAGPGGRHFADPDADDALVLPTVLALSKDGRLAIADPGANLVRILPAGSF